MNHQMLLQLLPLLKRDQKLSRFRKALQITLEKVYVDPISAVAIKNTSALNAESPFVVLTSSRPTYECIPARNRIHATCVESVSQEAISLNSTSGRIRV